MWQSNYYLHYKIKKDKSSILSCPVIKYTITLSLILSKKGSNCVLYVSICNMYFVCQGNKIVRKSNYGKADDTSTYGKLFVYSYRKLK